MTAIGSHSEANDPRPGAAGPLSGVRVVDLTAVFLGPYCTQILGDMGADVIKIESPEGDIVRGIGPARHEGMGPIYLNLNRSKRSVVLDLRKAPAREALLRIVAGADVFVHSMRPQAIARLGLTYEQVAGTRPDIVYCGAYGFGEQGAYAGRPAYDDIVQAAAGIAAVQGQTAGEPEYVTTVIADKTTGLAAAYAIAMALYHRERTGQGQAIEVPMFETMVSYLLAEQMYGMTFEPSLGSATYPRSTSPYRRPYRTADGHISVVVYTDAQWKRFFSLAGRPDLADDERFGTISGRTRHIDELYRLLGELLAQRPSAEWLRVLEHADIPAMALKTPEELLDDPHVRDCELIRSVEHPTEGAIRTVGIPVQFSRSPGRIDRLAPTLGEHGPEVLAEAGYSPSEIDALVGAGATVRPRVERVDV